MSFLRNAALATALLVAGQVHATDVSMASGTINFSTPDNWLGIMQTEGNPEVRVFQVPDPSPTASTTLARVTVTVKLVDDINGYKQYVASANAKALGLPGYHPARTTESNPYDYHYLATEAGQTIDYVEHYWYRDGRAIQLRCLRPKTSQAGTAWMTAFDKGCASIADQLAH